MLATASRAPSVHNTQPWRFAVGTHAIDLYADPERKLGQDRDGREMLISCGAALFGLRLAVRGLGYLPAVTLFSERSRPWLLARVALGPESAGHRGGTPDAGGTAAPAHPSRRVRPGPDTGRPAARAAA